MNEREPHKRLSGWRRRTIQAAVLITVAWIALVAGLTWSAYGHATNGRRHLNAAKDAFTVDAIVGGTVPTSLDPAASEFRKAHSRLANPIMAPAKLIPVLGRQLKSVTALAGAAADISASGAEAAQEIGSVLKKGAGSREGRIALVEGLTRSARDVRTKLSGVDLGPSEALFPTLHDARVEAAQELTEVRGVLNRVIDAGDGIAGFLEGPSRYVVMAANNSEMRAGSGMFLSIGMLGVDDGALNIDDFGDVPEFLPEGTVTLEGDLADRWGWTQPNREWRNLGMSPRFDVTGELASRMWQVSRGDQVDGVLALDVVTLRAILRATGPVVVDGKTIDESGVEQEVLHDQYLGVGGNITGRQIRRERMGRIASEAVRLLDQGEWDPGELATQLAEAARGRHILAWSSRPAEQKAWVASGIDGALERSSVMVSVLNRGGNKLDQFLEVSAAMDARPSGEGSEVTLRINLRNSVPPGQPEYILGFNPPRGPGAGVYSGILAVNLPGSTQQPRLDSNENLVVSGPDGPTVVYGKEVIVRPGENLEVLVQFVVPDRETGLTVEPSARLPAIKWQFGTQRWTDTEARRISLTSRH